MSGSDYRTDPSTEGSRRINNKAESRAAHSLHRLVMRLFGKDQEAEMRPRWLEVERASLECHQASLEALRAWRHGNIALQDKWTNEMNARLDRHAQLLEKWANDYQPHNALISRAGKTND